MMRSMYSGVSGLRVHQAKMDVIGNNIANVNTVGFKRSAVSFTEVLSQTIKGAGSPEGGRGGTNPQQIGLGVSLGAIDVIHSQGSTQRTDNPTDIMIDGNGMFVVSNDETGQNKFYTRAGNFSVDKLGYLVTSGGYKVLDEDFNAIQINKSETKNATRSSEIELQGNINYNADVDASTNIAYTTSIDVYDSVGDIHRISFNFGEKLVADTGDKTYRTVNIPGTPSFGDLDPASAPASGTTAAGPAGPIYAEFDDYGNFIQLVDQVQLDANREVVTASNYTANLQIQTSGAGVVDLNIDANLFANVTQYSATSDAKGIAIDGNSAGSIDSFNISSSGEIIGTFTNGERKVIATIGLADFDNVSGLMKMGNNLYVDTPNSGTPKFGAPGTGSFGSLTPGALEMSNVDLSSEFTEMITTQRGFQANSRVITTTDEMLQELVNLKR